MFSSDDMSTVMASWCVFVCVRALQGCVFLSKCFHRCFSGSEPPETDVLNPVRRQSRTPTHCFPQTPVECVRFFSEKLPLVISSLSCLRMTFSTRKSQQITHTSTSSLVSLRSGGFEHDLATGCGFSRLQRPLFIGQFRSPLMVVCFSTH